MQHRRTLWQWARLPGGGAAAAAPSDPTNLLATFVSNNRIDLAWDDNASNELGYKIERRVGSGEYEEIDSLAVPNLEAYSDLTVVEDASYTYRVRAYRVGNSHSGYTNTSAIETLPKPPANLDAVLLSSPSVPVAPSGLTATWVSRDEVTIEWTDNSSNETGFVIERSVGGAFVDAGTVTVNSTEFTDIFAEPDNTNIYRVRAVNAIGSSAYSNEDSIESQPFDPTDLVLTVVSDTAIDLEWTDNSSMESGYSIERKTGAGSFAEIDTVAADETTFSDTGLTAATTYTYRVRAFSANAESDYTDEVAETTDPQPVVPNVPTGLATTFVSNSRIDLAWTDTADNEVGFKISRAANGGAESDIATVATPNLQAYSDTTTSQDTSYTYRVRAYNAVGDSDKSNASTTPTLPAPPTVLAAVAASASQINLTWTDNAGREDGFRVERKTGVGGTYSEIVVLPADAVAYSATGLTDSTTYYFRVRAFNFSGNSAYSNEANATTDAVPPPPTLPNPPTGLVATFVSNSNISLVWGDNATNEVGFKVSRADNGGAFSDIATIAVANTVSYSDTTTSADNSYQYRVRAYNGVGDSANSNTASVVTRPTAPSSLNSTAISDTRIDLTWTDNSSVETSVTVQRSLTAGSGYSTIDTLPANAVAYSSTGLAPSTTYFYRVRMSNASGDSGFSNQAFSTTQATPTVPNAPTNFVPTFVTNTRIDLAWTDASSDETSFKVERADNGGAFAQIATPAANATSYSDTTVSADNSYVYRMRASNAVGNSAYTGEEAISTLCTVPSAFTATGVTQTSIQLAWTDNSSVETGYRVYRDVERDGSFMLLATLAADSSGYLDSGLTASQTVDYRVAAFNATGETITSTQSGTTQSGENLVIFSGDYPTGFEVADDEIGVISGLVTSAANVVVHGTLRMRPGATLRFRDINNALWSFDPPHATGEPDASDVGLWIHGNGVLDALGTEKTVWLNAAGSISAGATSIALASAPTGWLPGDEVLIAPTSASDRIAEILVIQGVSGTTLTLASPTAKAHPAVAADTLTMTAEICNLTRDVRIEGTASGRSHILFMDHLPALGGVPQTIRYVAIRHCGQHKPLSAGAPDASGRYGLHIHMMEDGSRGSLVEGVVIRDAFAHAFVAHMSHGVTFYKCITHMTAWEPYWWDEIDPSLPSGDNTAVPFTRTDDVLYQECIASKSFYPDEGKNNGLFHLGRGDGARIIDCVAFGNTTSNAGSGYHWPSTANVEPQVWEFRGCVAHNIAPHGIRTWQNEQNIHNELDDYTVYNCSGPAQSQGAYGTPGYHWSNFRLIGPGATSTSSGLILHSVNRQNPQSTVFPDRPDGYAMSFENGYIAGFFRGVAISRHNLPVTDDMPVLLKDIRFVNISSTLIQVNEVPNGDPGDFLINPGLWDFVDCTLDGDALVSSDVSVLTAEPGFRLRVQNGATAFQVDHNGTVTSIAPFYS